MHLNDESVISYLLVRTDGEDGSGMRLVAKKKKLKKINYTGTYGSSRTQRGRFMSTYFLLVYINQILNHTCFKTRHV